MPGTGMQVSFLICASETECVLGEIPTLLKIKWPTAGDDDDDGGGGYDESPSAK